MARALASRSAGVCAAAEIVEHTIMHAAIGPNARWKVMIAKRSTG